MRQPCRLYSKPSTSVAPPVVKKQNITSTSPCQDVTLGHMHQGNYIFSDFSRGRFCLPAAVIAIHNLHILETPTSQDIDEILFEADVLYSKIKNMLPVQQGTIEHAYLAFSDLPALIETTNEQFTSDLNDSDLLLGTCLSTNMGNLSLSEAVHNAALIIVGAQAFSVFLDSSGQFCYFDSHSRNIRGEQSCEGTAILMRFPTLNELQNQLFRLVRSIAHGDCSIRYELQPIQIHRTNQIDALPRVSVPIGPKTADSTLQFDNEQMDLTFQRTIPTRTTHVKCSNSFSVLSKDNFGDQTMSRQTNEGVSKEPQTIHEENCTKADTAKTFERIVQGSISEADHGFSQYNKYKLSISNAVISLVHLQSQPDLQSSDVNYVLLEGARLCEKYTPKISHSNLEIAIPKLLSSIDGMYTVEEMELFQGLLGNVARTRRQKQTNTLEGLTNAFRFSNTVIIALGKYVLSAFKADNGLYGIFNPNPCNSNGVPVHEGKSTVVFCITLKQMSETIETLAKHLLNKVTRYQIVSLKITMKQLNGAKQSPHTASFNVSDVPSTHSNDNTEFSQAKFDRREYRKQYMRKRRQENDAREMDREYIKKRRLDPQFKQSETEARMHRYSKNEISRQTELLRSQTRYRNDESIRRGKKAISATQYKENPHFRDKRKLYSATQYKETPQFRDKRKLYSATQYKENPQFRDKRKLYSATQYKETPHFRDKRKLYSATQYKETPHFRDKRKLYSVRKYKRNLNFRENVKAYSSTKYQHNPKFRAKVKDYSSTKYQHNPSFRLQATRARKLKYHSNDQFCEEEKQRRRLNHLKCTTDPSLHRRLKEMRRRQYCRNIQARRNKARERKKQIEQQRTRIERVKKEFANGIEDYPEYVCCVCHHLLFRKQCNKCDKNKYYTKSEARHVSNLCITEDFVHKCNTNCEADCHVRKESRSDLYICNTCQRHLSKGKIPPEAYANRLELHTVPQELQTLITLKKHLISLMVPFMKVIRLPKGGQQKLKGPCVMVPADLQKHIDYPATV